MTFKGQSCGGPKAKYCCYQMSLGGWHVKRDSVIWRTLLSPTPALGMNTSIWILQRN